MAPTSPAVHTHGRHPTGARAWRAQSCPDLAASLWSKGPRLEPEQNSKAEQASATYQGRWAVGKKPGARRPRVGVSRGLHSTHSPWPRPGRLRREMRLDSPSPPPWRWVGARLRRAWPRAPACITPRRKPQVPHQLLGRNYSAALASPTALGRAIISPLWSQPKLRHLEEDVI